MRHYVANPFTQTRAAFRIRKSCIEEDHRAIISSMPNTSPRRLIQRAIRLNVVPLRTTHHHARPIHVHGGHRCAHPVVKRFLLPHLEIRQTRVRNPNQNNSPCLIIRKINPFTHFPPAHRKQHRTSHRIRHNRRAILRNHTHHTTTTIATAALAFLKRMPNILLINNNLTTINHVHVHPNQTTTSAPIVAFAVAAIVAAVSAWFDKHRRLCGSDCVHDAGSFPS
mmetsp:Transcript_2677/g.5912  ORF Transcript_2677/g.5912 Transcript_2677/m.5912 type:complete len:224 (+) Transcript_2677:447-1118(+)